MKSLVCLMFVCLAFVSASLRIAPIQFIETPADSEAQLDLQTLQAIFNGLAQNAQKALPDLSACLDDNVAKSIKDFISNTADELAVCDFISIYDGAAKLKADLPPAINWCLNNNQQINDILAAYSLKDATAGTVISKFATYALTGYADELVNQAAQVKNSFKKSAYEEAGALAGKLLQSVMNYNPEAAPATLFALAADEEESSDYDGDLVPSVSFSFKDDVRDKISKLLDDSSDDDDAKTPKPLSFALIDDNSDSDDDLVL